VVRHRRISSAVLALTFTVSFQAVAAHAICQVNIPSPTLSTVPTLVLLVSRDVEGVADPFGEVLIVVRDWCGRLLPDRVVEISIVACPGARMAASGYPPGFTVDCSPTRKSLRRLSDANGEARFVVAGAAVPGANQSVACAEVRADGALLGRPYLAIPDLDGADGVGANDLSLWLAEFGAGDAGQGDFDGDGAIGANDLSVWLMVFAGGGSTVTPAPLCP